jgi:hypothetical protein
MTSKRKTQNRQTPNNIEGLAVSVALETCICSVAGSNFIRHFKYIDYFSLFSQLFKEHPRIGASISPLQNPSSHNSPITLTPLIA